MRYFITATLLFAGAIHLLPAYGVLGAERLLSLYGAPIVDPNIEILLRHRAILFGLLGGVLVYAAFKPALHGIAFTAGIVSVGTFLYLAWATGSYSSQISRVAFIDIVALLLLVAGAAVRFIFQPTQS